MSLPNGHVTQYPGVSASSYAQALDRAECPEVYDEAGTRILIGSRVECGAGEPGYVTAITEAEDTPGRVFVKWPEWDDPEGFTYHGTGWCWEGPNVCDEVEVIA